MVQVQHQKSYSTVLINYPPLNLLTSERIQEVIKAHQIADRYADSRVIVTRSLIPGIFSHGFDPKYLLEKNEKERAQCFQAISDLIFHTLSLKKPLICLVDGDAYAGGAVLAALADFLLFSEENGKICFSEAKVGLPLPRALIEVLQNKIAPSQLRNVVMLGNTLNALEAKACGLAHTVSGQNNLLESLEDLALKISRLSPDVISMNKRRLNHRALKLAKKLIKSLDSYTPFMGPSYLEEGLKSIVEKRRAKF